MSTFQERLIVEKDELNEKFEKLTQFINGKQYQSIEPVQQSLLQIQASAMFTYAKCLSERIYWLEKAEINVPTTK